LNVNIGGIGFIRSKNRKKVSEFRSSSIEGRIFIVTIVLRYMYLVSLRKTLSELHVVYLQLCHLERKFGGIHKIPNFGYLIPFNNNMTGQNRVHYQSHLVISVIFVPPGVFP